MFAYIWVITKEIKMLTSMRNQLTTLTTTILDIPRQLLNSYAGTLSSAAGITVLAVGFLGVTTFTVALGLILAVSAGLYNFYHNSDKV